MKVVINACFGGFGLSREAIDLICAEKEIDPGEWNSTWHFYSNFANRNIERNDPVLVDVVERLGKKSWGYCAELKVVEIPDGVDWEISEYDGSEHIAEKHRTWG